MLSQNKNYNIYPWQTGRQRSINVSEYALDTAFPSRISVRVDKLQRWFGLWKGSIVARAERRRHEESDPKTARDNEPETPRRMRQNMVSNTESVKTSGANIIII